jgi:anhydro-N-acetylmuramic acid kinase
MAANETYRVVGLMSGTSLDGLDIALCVFTRSDEWGFSIEKAETVSYTAEWRSRLAGLHVLSGEELVRRHVEYGVFLGRQVRDFLQRHRLSADFVSSHGHTVFHRPAEGFTFQVGCGASLAAAAGLPVVFDFRTGDVAMGGQGAPLVPIGDRRLFSDYSACLNLGGIANISFERGTDRIAYDVSPCNLLLNHLAGREGKDFDEDGIIAARGKVQDRLLEALERVDFYSLPYPKSLGREDIEDYFLPLLSDEFSLEDSMATVCRHIAMQVARALARETCQGRMLVTGGGALHLQLMKELEKACPVEVVAGTSELVHFKEALVFAFLGVLRMRNEVNVLRSVTGASADHVAGSIALP